MNQEGFLILFRVYRADKASSDFQIIFKIRETLRSGVYYLYKNWWQKNSSAGLEFSEIEQNRIYPVLNGNRTFMPLYKGWRKK
jgi:hypothetical protein